MQGLQPPCPWLLLPSWQRVQLPFLQQGQALPLLGRRQGWQIWQGPSFWLLLPFWQVRERLRVQLQGPWLPRLFWRVQRRWLLQVPLLPRGLLFWLEPEQ